MAFNRIGGTCSHGGSRKSGDESGDESDEEATRAWERGCDAEEMAIRLVLENRLRFAVRQFNLRMQERRMGSILRQVC